MNFRKPAIMALVGVSSFSLVMGAAASLLVDTDDLGAGTIDVASCDADGVDVQYVTSPVASDDPTADGGATEGEALPAPDLDDNQTDSLDPATASVGTPNYFVTHVQVSGIDPLCDGQQIEIALYCDTTINHNLDDGDTVAPEGDGLGNFDPAESNCPAAAAGDDGAGQYRFISSNNTAGATTPRTVTVVAGDAVQQFDVIDVEASFVDQVAVLITGEENDGV